MRVEDSKKLAGLLSEVRRLYILADQTNSSRYILAHKAAAEKVREFRTGIAEKYPPAGGRKELPGAWMKSGHLESHHIGTTPNRSYLESSSRRLNTQQVLRHRTQGQLLQSIEADEAQIKSGSGDTKLKARLKMNKEELKRREPRDKKPRGKRV